MTAQRIDDRREAELALPKLVLTMWQTGAGQPRWELETLAVRGERFAAVAVQTDYGNGMLRDSLTVIGLDVTLKRVQRHVDFDRDDVARAIAELDRMHGQAGVMHPGTSN